MKELTGLAKTADGRDFITTAEAAKMLNRQEQTLRKWACLGNGPISPVRLSARLMWRVSDISDLLTNAK